MNITTSFTGMYYDPANNKELQVKPMFDAGMLEVHNKKLDAAITSDSFSIEKKAIGDALVVGETEYIVTDTFVSTANIPEGTKYTVSTEADSESFVGNNNIPLLKNLITKCQQLLGK